jgi:hypothetical protein
MLAIDCCFQYNAMACHTGIMQVAQGGAFTVRSSTAAVTATAAAAAAAVVPQMTLAAAGNPLIVLKGIVTGVKVCCILYNSSYSKSASICS